jgi:hypothetical protein
MEFTGDHTIGGVDESGGVKIVKYVKVRFSNYRNPSVSS